MKKIIPMSLAVLFAASLSFSLQAAENPFGMSDLNTSSKVAMSSMPDGKCGGSDKKEGKCGGSDKKDGKCGGADKKDGKCGGS